MILVRTGGIFGLVIAAMVAALFLFVVRPAINDTTDRAFDTADRALDATRAGQIERDRRSTPAATTSPPPRSAPSSGRSSRSSAATPSCSTCTVSEQGGGNVKYRTGDRAAGFQWGPGRDGLEPVRVTLVGSGKLADNVFPIAKLDAGRDRPSSPPPCSPRPARTSTSRR